MVVTAPPGTQTKLIKAVAPANVAWIIPNGFGVDTFDLEIGKDFFFGCAHAKDRERIESLGKSFWITIVCGFWYELSLSGGPFRYEFDFKERSVQLYDKGRTKIDTSTWL